MWAQDLPLHYSWPHAVWPLTERLAEFCAQILDILHEIFEGSAGAAGLLPVVLPCCSLLAIQISKCVHADSPGTFVNSWYNYAVPSVSLCVESTSVNKWVEKTWQKLLVCDNKLDSRCTKFTKHLFIYWFIYWTRLFTNSRNVKYKEGSKTWNASLRKSLINYALIVPNFCIRRHILHESVKSVRNYAWA